MYKSIKFGYDIHFVFKMKVIIISRSINKLTLSLRCLVLFQIFISKAMVCGVLYGCFGLLLHKRGFHFVSDLNSIIQYNYAKYTRSVGCWHMRSVGCWHML